MPALKGLTPSWVVARANLSRRWKSAVVIAALIGIAGTVVLTAYAGARRTDSAYARYLRSTHAADFLVATANSDAPATNHFYRQLGALPEVQRSGVLFGPSLWALSGPGQVDFGGKTSVQTYASEDGRAGYTVVGYKLLSGRMPQPDRPFEALANRTLAMQRHLHVGSRFNMYPANTNDFPAAVVQAVRHEKPTTFTITGIGVSYDEIVPVAPDDGLPTLFVTPAYYRDHHSRAETNFDGVGVELRAGASQAAFEAATSRAWRADGGARALTALFVANLTLHYARAERAIHPEALVLELFALFVALGAVVAIGDVLAREVQLSSDEDATLSALGLDRRQIVAATMLWLSFPILVGAAVSVVGAIAASSLMPIGPARIAEPNPGISVDFGVLATGFLGLIVVFGTLSWAKAWSLARSSTPGKAGLAPVTAKPWRGAEALGRAGLSPPAVNGLSMAFAPGRGAASLPVRSAVLGAVLAVAAVVGAITFGANLNRLVTTPSLFGVTWDVGLDSGFQPLSRDQLMAMAGHLHGVTGIAAGVYGDDVLIDGSSVPAVGIDTLEGSLFPTILQGRQPVGPGEVGLGAGTMRELHTKIGDWVTLSAGSQPRRLKVVSEVVFPSFGQGSFTPTDLGEGAITAANVVGPSRDGQSAYNFLLLRLSKRARPTAAAAVDEIAARIGCPPGVCLMTTANLLPTDVQSYDRVRATPLYLAAILAFFGAAMVGHALVSSVRRRRRDLALLKTLGLSTGQIAATVAWQATAFAAVGVVVGLPTGILLGRWLWSIFAAEIGVPNASAFPLGVLLVVPAVVVLANVIAAVPGQSAAHMRVAPVLRAE